MGYWASADGVAIVGTREGDQSMSSIRVALVDHQPTFSRGLELLLPALTENRVRVVARTDDATAAAMMVHRSYPDLAAVDLDLPAPGGLRAIAAIRRMHPRVPIVAMGDLGPDGLDGPEANDKVVAALRVGALGFLHKTGEPEALVAPLLAVFEGWVVIPAEALRRMLTTSTQHHPSWQGMTEVDRRLWRLIAAGRSTQDVAVEMGVSDRTAKRLTAALLRRLGVANRTQAATLAGRTGMSEE